MASIPLGAKGTFTLVVAPQQLANQFKDATLPPVLAAPVMIMAMENAALNALKPYLEPGAVAAAPPHSPLIRRAASIRPLRPGSGHGSAAAPEPSGVTCRAHRCTTPI